MDVQEGDRAGTGLAATVEHYGDGAGSPELSYGDGKSGATKGRSATASELYRAAKEARGSHDGAFSCASTTPQTAMTHPERRRRSPSM